MLDEAGFSDCKIVASNSLDEYSIGDILTQGAKIDVFGVGERLITSKTEPVFGGVYKLAGIEDNGNILPKMKISENVAKITNPGFKRLFRLFDKNNNKAIADVITCDDEVINDSEAYEIFDPDHTWKRKVVTDFYAKQLLIKIFDKGKCVYNMPKLDDIREYARNQIETLWDEILRFENPHRYYVDLSEKLWTIKDELLKSLTDVG